ncbi:ribbon-helix-helix protein, CopG family [Actinosynnema sp. CA-248983]
MTPKQESKRINVAITPDTARALEAVTAAEGVSLTEALRRLVSYGDFVYRAIKQDNAEVLLKTGDTTRAVILL